MAKKVGNVEFYCGPESIGAPDNLEDTIINFINGANKRLEIAVQELENIKIAEAIIDARKRKVLVKIVLEQDYLKSSTAKKNPWMSGGSNEENRMIQNALFRAKIDLKLDYNTGIFHQKFIVRDRASVLTGSTNFTPTGTYNNLNHVVIIHDTKIAKIYAKEFKEIQRGHFGKFNASHDSRPLDTVVSNIPIKVLFAPDHNPEMEIMKQMLKAKSRIDFAIFTFSKSSGIDDTMIKLLKFGTSITGAFDGQQGAQDWAAIPALKSNGAKLSSIGKKGDLGKLHHKLMVLDDQVVIAGSFNYTGPANQINDENIIILGDLNTSSSTQKKAQSKIASYARNEIDRIIKQHGARL